MRRGFTLVELSIVLVIIGLLIGGILVAQSMISTVKSQKVISELNQYSIFVNNFKSIYNYLPGDLPNGATLFPSCTATFTGGPQSSNCNGDGDGVIDNDGTNSEFSRVWEHLSLAGVISGNYRAQDHYQCQGTYCAPAMSFTKVRSSSNDGNNMTITLLLYYITTAPPLSAWSGAGALVNNPGHYLVLRRSGDSVQYSSGVLSSSIASGVDGKVDDGLPFTGNVRAYNPGSYPGLNASFRPCVNGVYVNNNLEDGCMLSMKVDF